MTDDSLDARLRAVERAVTDGEASVADLSDAAAVHDRLDALERELAELTERVDALDTTVQSLHGYVGEIEHVNERVERRADAARAAVERLSFEVHATIGVVVPSGPRGVGDVGGDADERSPGW